MLIYEHNLAHLFYSVNQVLSYNINKEYILIRKLSELDRMPDIDKELEKIEKGGAWDESDEVVQVEVKKPLKITIRITKQKQVH